MNQQRTIGLILGIALAVGACGSSAADTTSTAPDDASASVDPGDGGGGGAGGGGTVPTIADGRYIGGKAHLEVSGDRQASTDMDLIAAASITNGTTSLSYLVGSGADSITIQLALDPETGVGFNVISNLGLIAGSSEQGCQVAFTRNDGSGISGTIVCRGIEGIVSGGIDGMTVDVSISFSADR